MISTTVILVSRPKKRLQTPFIALIEKTKKDARPEDEVAALVDSKSARAAKVLASTIKEDTPAPDDTRILLKAVEVLAQASTAAEP